MKGRRESFLIFGIVFACLLLAYLPVYLLEYVHHDDIVFFLEGPTFALYSCFDMNFSAGRFLGAWILSAASYVIESVRDLWVFRLISLLLLVLVGFRLARRLRTFFSSPVTAGLLAGLALTLPAFGILASYVGIYFQILGIFFGLWAAEVVFDVDPERPLLQRIMGLRTLSAVILFVSAICVYQPTAMFYWACLAPMILFFKGRDRVLWTTTLHFYVVGFLGLILYAATLFLMRTRIEAAASLGYNPFLISLRIGHKLLWFFEVPFHNALNLWNIYPRAILGWAVAGYMIISATFFLYQWVRTESPVGASKARAIVFRVLALIMLFPLSFLPSLVWSGDVSYYRCLAGLSFLVICVLGWVTFGWIERLSGPKAPWIVLCFMVVATIAGAAASASNLYRYVAYPNHLEFRYVRDQVQKTNPDTYVQLCFIKPDRRRFHNRYDEFGFPTLYEDRNNLGMYTASLVDLIHKRYFILSVRFDRVLKVARFFLFDKKSSRTAYLEKRIITAPGQGHQPFAAPTLYVDMTLLYQTGGPLEYLVK